MTSFLSLRNARSTSYQMCEDLMNEPNPDAAVVKLAAPAPYSMQPVDFISTHFNSAACPERTRFRHGTTCLAFTYEPATPADKGGIIVSVDSRATGGAHIASKTVMKMLDVAPHLVATMAGGAADCQFWIRYLAKYCKLYEMREKEPISVAAASKYLANVLYGYKGRGLSIGTLIGGYDKTGARLYMVDSEGARVAGNMFSVGSGCLYAYGILDQFYKPKMTDAEAMKLGRDAIVHATFRDVGSGGYNNVQWITKDGKQKFPPVDVSEYVHTTCPMASDQTRNQGIPGVDF